MGLWFLSSYTETVSVWDENIKENIWGPTKEDNVIGELKQTQKWMS